MQFKQTFEQLIVNKLLKLPFGTQVEVEYPRGTRSRIDMATLAEIPGLVDELNALAGLDAELALLEGLTATATEINLKCDNSVRCEIVTATNVITAAESGKVFFLDAVAGFLSTLPSPALGLEFTFVVKTPPTSNGYTIDTTGSANIIKGGAIEYAGTASPASAVGDLLTLVANVALAGDQVHVISDGTNWYLDGGVAADGALTIGST